MTDEMDFSWLEREWKKARAVQAGQEMFADYTRYMRDLGATEVSKIIDSLDPTVVESDPVEAESIFALAPSSSFTTVKTHDAFSLR